MGTLNTLHFKLILTEIIAISDIGIATITSLVNTRDHIEAAMCDSEPDPNIMPDM